MQAVKRTVAVVAIVVGAIAFPAMSSASTSSADLGGNSVLVSKLVWSWGG